MLNPLDFSGRRILVTGASSGIGLETAKLLSALGAKLVVTGRNQERLEQLLGELEGDGHHAFPADLSIAESIPSWMKTMTASTGPLAGLVHCAGINLPRPLRILLTQDILAINAINTTAALMLAKGFRQRGVCAEEGSIVFVSSIAALKGQPGLAAYAASKGALISLTRTLGVEMAREKIRVNCLCPGAVRTQMADELESRMTPEAYRQMCDAYPLGLGTPLDVGYAIAFFLSSASRWITGASLVLDGGLTA